MNSLDNRLDALRGNAKPLNYTARTIAALTNNPGCGRRTLMDAAGIDKTRVAAHVGFPTQFGMSPFALARGNAFEAQVKANGCAELLRLLRDKLGLRHPGGLLRPPRRRRRPHGPHRALPAHPVRAAARPAER